MHRTASSIQYTTTGPHTTERPNFCECARVFAERIANSPADDVAGKIDWAYEQAVSRLPGQEIQQVLLDLHASQREHYQANPSEAQALLKTGIAPAPDAAVAIELAAWTAVARVILNLHETITRY